MEARKMTPIWKINYTVHAKAEQANFLIQIKCRILQGQERSHPSAPNENTGFIEPGTGKGCFHLC